MTRVPVLCVALGAAFISVGCSVLRTPPPRIWAQNESSNTYVVRTTHGESGQVVGSWSLPADAAGLAGAGSDGLWVHVLDAGTCSIVVNGPVEETTAINIDVRGRVAFVDSHIPPSLNRELIETTTCEPEATPPPRVTS